MALDPASNLLASWEKRVREGGKFIYPKNMWDNKWDTIFKYSDKVLKRKWVKKCGEKIKII